MSYTNIWSDTSPTGAEAANTIDDIFRSLKVDIEQRLIDIFGTMPNFTADPLRPYGLKFTDAATAKIFLGDNAGTPRSLIVRNKADTVSYFDLAPTILTLGPTVDFAVVATKKIFLDGGGDTYIYEISANVLDFFVGGTKIIELTTTYVDFRLSNVILSSTQKLFLDGGGDTYLQETSANVLQFVAGGVQNLTLQPTSAIFAAAIGVIVGGTLDIRAGLSVGAAAVPDHGIAFGSAAPSVLANGQIWFDGTDFKARQGGTTKTITLA